MNGFDLEGSGNHHQIDTEPQASTSASHIEHSHNHNHIHIHHFTTLQAAEEMSKAIQAAKHSLRSTIRGRLASLSDQVLQSQCK